MNKILNQKDITKIKKIKDIVLVGGCFDILHRGHIFFLDEARKKGSLVVLLESDESVKKMKGQNRPINDQEDRALILSCLKMVNYVINLNGILSNSDYDNLIREINPKFIAATEGDNKLEHKKRQAKEVGAKILLVKEIKGISTTKILKNL